ncbi:tetratricopeptide repeat protein [uncultured Pseudacidovorax sp.]|uniref:tetratricopeptide repeat protein n=1 Tax=uncultured Pseudacidovorax sp. TaxID=679313 RepID=UPI0025D2E22D|nr:tetratricopeptide repeat protein [uncultured Pseudacidovorax sp.]
MTHAASSVARSLIRASLACLLVAGAGAALADDYAEVNALLRTGKAAEALDKADRYIAGNPRDPQMRFLRGVILSEQGKPQDAADTFVKLTQDYPELPEPYNNLAVIYAAQGQLDKARDALDNALRLNPNYAVAHENLGDVYVRMAARQYNRAQSFASTSSSVAPKLALVRQLVDSTGNAANGKLPAATPEQRRIVR